MWSLSDIGLLLITACLAGLAVAFLVGIFKLVGWLLTGAGITPYPVKVERIVMGHVSLLVRQNLPLPTALALAAESEGGGARTCLRDLSRLLGQGLPLSEAAAKARLRYSDLTLSLLAAGEKSGQLARALDQVQEHLAQKDTPPLVSLRVVLGYFLLLMIATSIIVSLVLMLIVPKLGEIFKDFGSAMPALTMSLIAVADWFVQGTPPGWLWMAALLAVILYLKFRWRKRPPPRWVRYVVDRMLWYVPVMRRATFSDGMATMLETMRLALRSGMDVTAAAKLASEVRVNSLLRARMKHFAARIENGAAAGVAASEAGLGEVTAVAMAAGQRSSDMDAALRYAADYHAALVSRLWIMLRNLAGPLCTLVGATVIGWVVLALFLPVIRLIDATMATSC